MKLQRFRAARLTRPTESFPAPELVGVLFDNGETAALDIRGLTANQLYIAREAQQGNTVTRALQKALASRNEGELTEAFQRTLAIGKEEATAAETAYRIEVVRLGVTNGDGGPCLEQEDVVRLAEHFPMTFIRLSTRILELSGEVSTLGEA